jgi:hypothetical protein
MGGEYRRVEVSLNIPDADQLPRLADGGHMYPDDVVEEVTAAVRAAVTTWYETRGKDLLRSEPLMI